MTKILVTGAGGLLGREFCRKLKDKNYEVWAIDNHSRSDAIPKCDRFIKQDLNDLNLYDTLPTDFNYIYHYSAINGTTNFYNFPNKVLENNFICDLNLFKFAEKQKNLLKLVYASSSEIVADDIENPVKENKNVFIKNIHNARWSYRIAKMASENYLANSNLPWVILRYFNIYGENSKEGHFLGDQIKKISNNIFTVIGPTETRSFCYVEDAIIASIFVAENTTKEVVNIGNDREISVGDAVKIIAKTMGKEASFEELPGRQGSVTNRRPNISKLRSIMPDYSPKSFEDGIKQIISNLSCN